MSGAFGRGGALSKNAGREPVSEETLRFSAPSLTKWRTAPWLAFPGFHHPTARVLTRTELRQQGYWRQAFEGKRKDSRYYELVEHTLCPDFQFRYLMLMDALGEVRTIQPFFIVDQDILAGLGPKAFAIVAMIRRYWPGFLRLRTLMVGCAAGEGHLNTERELSHDSQIPALADALIRQARDFKARLIVFKSSRDPIGKRCIRCWTEVLDGFRACR